MKQHMAGSWRRGCHLKERRPKRLIHVDSHEMVFLREMEDERWMLHIP